MKLRNHILCLLTVLCLMGIFSATHAAATDIDPSQYVTQEAAVVQLRKALVKHDEIITAHVKSDTKLTAAMLYDAAVAHTGVPNEGDYIRYNTRGYDLEVTHNLLGLPGAALDDIKTVISHPQALEQCAKYIKKHGFEAVRANNTAIAAQKVSEGGDKTVAAIASRDTAKLYGLNVLERRINESSVNTTRFAVFSRAESLPDYKETGRQFIMVFTVRNEAGALAKAINIIGDCGFNMRTLRSRPMKELMWNYYFYVEADGNAYSEEGKRMMKELSPYCDKLRIIGSFPHEKKL